MTNAFTQTFILQWADLDPNFHVRHSVYYDWCASTRLYCLQQQGVDMLFLSQHNIGPILFREEAIFKKEIRFGHTVTIDMQLSRARRDYSRWSWTHQVTRNDGTLSAVVHVDGAFMNTQLRKLTAPPEKLLNLMGEIPKTADFSWEEEKTS